MKTSKKLLSFFLAVVMVVTTCSVGFTAFAQDNRNSIWSTSCEAEDAFDTLNGLADEYLPAVFMGISSSISTPVYEKYAEKIGKTAATLSEHEKNVILGEEKATADEAKKGLQAATIQDVIGALQPLLLGLFSDDQDSYPSEVLGALAASTDPSYYDYLLKYVVDENGNEIVDEDGNKTLDENTMSFFALYSLCKEYRNADGLDSDVKDTLKKWYDQMSEIANIKLTDDIKDTILKHAKKYSDAGGLGEVSDMIYGISETYDGAKLWELEYFFDDEYMKDVSDEDKAIIASACEKYEEEFSKYNCDVTIDSLAKVIYYAYGEGRDIKYVYAYCDLLSSIGTEITFSGSADFCDFGTEYEIEISEPLTPENYVEEMVYPSALAFADSEGMITEETDSDGNVKYMWDPLGEGLVEFTTDDFYMAMIGDTDLGRDYYTDIATDHFLDEIMDLYYEDILAAMAVKYSDGINSKDDFVAAVKSDMPAGYENGITAFLSDDEIKEMGSVLRTVGMQDNEKGMNFVRNYYSNGSLDATDFHGVAVTPAVPDAMRNTKLSEYFSLIYTDSDMKTPYTRSFARAFYSKVDDAQYENFLLADGTPAANPMIGELQRYENSNLLVLNYGEDAVYDTDTIDSYISDAERFAYSKTAAELFGAEDLMKTYSETNVPKSTFDYKAFIDRLNEPEAAKVVLTDEQKEILYADYDLTGEIGMELLNYILNTTIVSLLQNEMVASIVNPLVSDLIGDIDLIALVDNIWMRLYKAPVDTVFEILPVLVMIIDSMLVPLLFNAEGDTYYDFLLPLLNENISAISESVASTIASLMYDNGSYIGIDQLSWDLNELLPDLMHWLFEGKNAEGIEYYEGGSKILMTADDNGNVFEKIFTLDNCSDIDFEHYSVADRNANALTAEFAEDKNGDTYIESYSYLGKTVKVDGEDPTDALKALLADYADTEFLCTMTYRSDVPYLTGIYVADLALRGAKITDLNRMLSESLGTDLGTVLYEVIYEIATLFTESVDEFVNSDRVNQVRYASNGKSFACSGLNNLLVAIPQLFDIMEDLSADKYGVSKNEWTYCYDGKIYVDEQGSTRNKRVVEFTSYATSSDPDRAVDILDSFADLFVGDWLNAILSLLDAAFATDNSISNNIPIISGLLEALGGLGETSIVTDLLNGIFQIDRSSEYSFTFEKQENGLTGLSKDHAYFLITNIKTLVNVIMNLVDSFTSDGDGGDDSDSSSDSSSSSSSKSPVYKPKAAKTANADKSNYSAAELSNATDLINNLDKMLSSLLSDSSFNGFNLDSTENILAGVVTFFSNYLGNDCFTELGKVLNSYVFYITGSETHTPDKNGNVDAKKVYTNESLTGLVVETFLLIEKIVENLLGDFYDTYTLDNGNKAQYNLLVEAIEGLISPDAIGIRLTGYDKVQKKLSDYNCWHNAAAQTSRGDYKIKLDWGIKAGDKDAFYDGLAASLRLITSILGVLFIDTNWYATVISPVLGALCTPNGIKIDTAAQYKKTTNGYYDEALLGILRPVSEWINIFLEKPATTLIKSIQGIAGILDDKNGATIASILKGAITPIANEIKGLGKIFSIESDKLTATSPTLTKILNNLANTIGAYADVNNIKLGQGDYKYALTGSNLIPIINSYLASTGITLKKINWNKLSTAKTPAAALVYVLEYVFEVLLDNDNLTAIAKLINDDTATLIFDAIKAGKITAKDILSALNTILEASDSPTLVYWTFSQYLQEAATGFYYPAGVTKQSADAGVDSLDDLVANLFPLLSSFGIDLGGNNLQDIISNNLFTNKLLTTLATALYGALDGLDPTIKEVLKSLGIVTSTKDVAKLLTDKSYGQTYTAAANTIKAQSSWKNVKNVNWGFTDGSAKAQQGFVNALAAILRPLYDILEIFLNEGTLELNDILYDVICSLDVPYTVDIIEISDDKDAPIQLKFSYRMKDGVLRMKFREYEGNRERSRSSELRLDFTSLENLKDLKIEGTNGYNSAIIPLLEALGCSNISTYAQYQKHVANAKDNLLLDVLNPLIGDSSSSFLNKLAANPVSVLAELLPNVAMYLDAHGLSQLLSNLLAPVTEIIYTVADKLSLNEIIEEILGESLGDTIGSLLGLKKGSLTIDLTDLTTLNIEDLIIPVINALLFKGSDDPALRKMELKNINWNALISLGTKTTYTSKATDANGKFLTGKMVGNVDQGKVLITVLRYVADFLVDNATVLKNLICSIDGIKNSKSADIIISIITSVFNTISTASSDQIVAGVFYLLAGQPENAFWDYTGYKTGSYSFSYPENMDVDFLTTLPPMLDGLISGLIDLNGLVSEALFTDEIISKMAVGLYGAIDGVKISDDLNLTQLLAMTDIDFSTSNVAKLLVDEKYGQKFESASATISAAGSWKNVNTDSLKWGVTDRDSFFHALVAVLRPLYGVLDVLLNDGYLGLFDLVRLPGSNGYTSSIVPLMEAFSMYNIKTQYQYRQDIVKEYDAILLDIINPIWDWVEDVLNAPIQTIAAVVPNLALFIGNDGLCQVLDNLLTPISALIDSISCVVDLNDLLDTLFDALNVDLNGLLSKIGITNFSLDIYDISKTLKPILSGDALIPLVNNILGLIDIGGTKLNLKLNAVDWLQLASHGTTVVSSSQAATYGSRIFVQGDSSETLIAVLRYLIDTVNAGDNFDSICDLIGGLLGDDVDASVTDIINQVLGMLEGDTDEVISSLVELLQTFA